ncbi:MAG: hypothetical protein EBX52_03265 [Proteobacteria bacterium]|nr:hypothetical protein [Pseudomonadota bacterium]
MLGENRAFWITMGFVIFFVRVPEWNVRAYQTQRGERGSGQGTDFASSKPVILKNFGWQGWTGVFRIFGRAASVDYFNVIGAPWGKVL